MGMESGSGLSVADALALQDRGNDGMFGGANGTWIWVFFLFFLLAWGGGGFGFGNNAETAWAENNTGNKSTYYLWKMNFFCN